MIEFISMVLVLAVVYFAKLDMAFCHFRWVDRYQKFIKSKFDKLDGYVEFFFIVLSLLLIIGLVAWIISHWGTVASLIFQTALLFYAIISIDFRKKIKTYVGLLESDPTAASDYVHESLYPSDEIADMTPRQMGLAALFQQAQQGLFSMLFWFIASAAIFAALFGSTLVIDPSSPRAFLEALSFDHVLSWATVGGAVGLTLYRLCYYFANEQRDELQLKAATIQHILDWVPVRLFALSMALMSHFVVVVKVLASHMFKGLRANASLLSACGFAALGLHAGEDIAADKPLEKEVLPLIDRSLLVWLVVIALLTLRLPY